MCTKPTCARVRLWDDASATVSQATAGLTQHVNVCPSAALH